MAKPLSQLGKDIQAGLELGLEKAAHDITYQLKDQGPYWTGEFEQAWVVKTGQGPIASNKAGVPLDEVPEDPLQRPAEPSPTAVPLPDLKKGYAIGNEMDYADIAMDLVPGADGTYRGERPRETSKTGRDWFERYVLGGGMKQTVAGAMKDGFGVAGFK